MTPGWTVAEAAGAQSAAEAVDAPPQRGDEQESGEKGLAHIGTNAGAPENLP